MSRSRLIRLAILVLGLLAYRAYLAYHRAPATVGKGNPEVAARVQADPVTVAFRGMTGSVPVAGYGVVTRILPDDREGGRHQRFLLRTSGGTSVLIAHNIDIAPKLQPLHLGDTVHFSGEYIYNVQGGVVHWTHHDPAGRHPAGFLAIGADTVR